MKNKKALPKLNLTYFTCMYGRKELSKIFLENVKNTQKDFEKDIKIRMAVAYSEDADLEAIEETGIDATVSKVPNTYVGKKWNAALYIAHSAFGDTTHYYVKADDDGILTKEGMRLLIAAMRQNHPYIGFKGEVYLAPERHLASFAKYPIHNKVMGTLKTYHHNTIHAAGLDVQVEFIQRVDLENFNARRGEVRTVKYNWAMVLIQHGIAKIPDEQLPKMNTGLWENEWQRNLDWNSDLRLGYHGITPYVIDSFKPLLFNVKLPGKNIWEYDMRKNDGQPYSYNAALSQMRDNERQMLLQLADPITI